MKKLNLSKDKCHRLHIGKQSRKDTNCSELKVHEEKMETSSQEKYLGDIIHKSGTPKVNFEERRKDMQLFLRS